MQAAHSTLYAVAPRRTLTLVPRGAPPMTSPRDDYSARIAALRPMLVALARRMCATARDPDQLADDVVQETTLRMLKARERYRAEANLPAIAARALSNCLKDHWRREQVRAPAPLEAVAESEPAAPDGNGELPWWQALRTEDVIAVVAALELPLREVWLLRERDGKSPREIAEVMQLPVERVYAALFRARRELRRLLEDQYRARYDR